ncbi:MAG: hypothetical protein ABEI96_06250 [Haloarculaceae archaeon]
MSDVARASSTHTRTLLAAMLREEWRLHSDLFGGRRFAAFPAFVALISAEAVYGLVWTGTGYGTVVAGVNALTFAFGLYTGTIGLVGRDAIRNLLGDVTLVLFAARTLPVSRRRLLGVFVLKDLLYYIALFLLPLTVAFVPAALAGYGPVGRLPLLVASLALTFALGLGITFAAISLSTRGLAGRTLLVVAAAAVGVAWALGATPAWYVTGGVYATPVSLRTAVLLAAAVALIAVGLAAYDPTYTSPARTATGGFERYHGRLPFDADGLVAKSLLDVTRSHGGVWKVLFSGGILFAVSAVLVPAVETVTGVSPSTGVAFGAMLGLSGFTTYNWLTQFDSVAEYLTLPVSVAALFRAKGVGFLLLALPAALAYYLLALALFGARVPEAATGVVLLVGITVYLFGLTTALAGFSPNEFLFDTVLFAAFTVAIAVPLVPALVVGFVVVPVPAPLLGALLVEGGVLALVGGLLYRRAIPKWSVRYRRE